MKNFHLPLPDQTYSQLRAAAERTELSATALAREAIDTWLREHNRQTQRTALAEWAEQYAGTRFDLDPVLEAAGLDHLANTLYASPAKKRR